MSRLKDIVQQRRERSSSRLFRSALAVAFLWCFFTVTAVWQIPESHLLEDIAATERNLLAKESKLLGKITARYGSTMASVTNHHNPLAVALGSFADESGPRSVPKPAKTTTTKTTKTTAADVGPVHDAGGVGLEVPVPEPEKTRKPPPPPLDPLLQPQIRPQAQKLLAANHENALHPVAGLDCTEHGGPMDPRDANEMVYWRNVPGDDRFVSPFRDPEQRRYLTFEPDGGGWNNIRMSMETVLALAVATGRVLVLPPSQRMYLLGSTTFNFADFFPLQELAEEHAGLEIISTAQFLRETMGTVRNVNSRQVSYPPGKKTDWDGDTMGIKTELAPWLRSVALMPDCDPSDCILGIPGSAGGADAGELERAFREILEEDGGRYAGKDAHELFVGNPTPVDAPYRDRLKEFLAGRSKILVYDEKHQAAHVMHFHGKSTSRRRKQQRDVLPDPGGRLLVHFYAFLFFQDWNRDLWTKRFVRDHLRYVDHVQCAAARVVHALRTTHGGTFDSFHIRRGDFQYKKTRVSATEIVGAAGDVIPEGRVVYVGTDERDKNFFKPLVEEAGWNVFFLDDFREVIGDAIDPHYYGMIDQLVVSRGDSFFGCWFSTFTGYIMRLRGYHSPAAIAAGHPESEALADGKLPHSYFYTLPESRTRMHEYWPVKQAFYAREFPAAWRHIDKNAAGAP